VIRAPVQAPNANALAERWVRTVRAAGHTARFASYHPAAATQRRRPSPQAFAVGISSADSSTNTTPPEFANPTRCKRRGVRLAAGPV
jgi:hypothetical protein